MYSYHRHHLSSSSKRQLLRPANSFLKANIYLEQWCGKNTIVKDFSHSPAILRKTLIRFIMKREIRALRQLSSMENVPDLIEEISDSAFRIQYVKGESPTSEQLGKNLNLLEQLDQLVKTMHHLGITHNDIRPSNLILTPSNALFLIDFGAIYFRPTCRFFHGFLGYWLFDYLQHTDRSKVSRLKLEFSPEAVTGTDRELVRETAFARKTTKIWKKYVLPLISPTKHRKKK